LGVFPRAYLFWNKRWCRNFKTRLGQGVFVHLSIHITLNNPKKKIEINAIKTNFTSWTSHGFTKLIIV